MPPNTIRFKHIPSNHVILELVGVDSETTLMELRAKVEERMATDKHLLMRRFAKWHRLSARDGSNLSEITEAILSKSLADLGIEDYSVFGLEGPMVDTLELQKRIRELEKESSDLQAENDKIKKRMSMVAISVARQNKDIQTFVDDFVEDIDEHWATSVGHTIKFRSHFEEALEMQLASLVGQKNYAQFSPTNPVPLTFPATDCRRRIMTTDAVKKSWSDLVEANDRCRDRLKEMLRDSVVRLPLVEIDGINDDIDDLTVLAPSVTNVQPNFGSSDDFGDEALLDRVMAKYSEIKESLAVATRMIGKGAM